MDFLERYIQFLNELEEINLNHDELTDTDVRERLHEVINYYFVWGNHVESDFPQRFSMFTPEGDKQVYKAVYSFIMDAIRWADVEKIELGQARNSLIEDEKAISSEGNSYWLFLGFSEDVLPMKKPAPDEIFDYSDDDAD